MTKVNKYRVADELLHKKNLGKHTLTNRIVSIHSATDSRASSFYHYTSPEGLVGILQNRHFYFTDCEFLNDYKERLEINNELDKFWLKHRNHYDKEFFKILEPIRMNEYEDSDFSYYEKDEVEVPCRYFVFSTSRYKDSLSMWKYYAKNGTYNGYYIELNTHSLIDEWIDRDTGVAVEIGGVLYDSEEKQIRIYEEIEKLYDVWCRYKRSDKLDNKIYRDFRAWVSYASIFFKNECFADEGEYRFVAIAPKDKLSDLCYEYKKQKIKMYDFRIVSGTIIPYLKMPFCFWNVEECWAFDSIGLGPTLQSDLLEKGVNQFITSLDYKIGGYFSIRKSQIPLRY